ncbi:pre-tRNA nuclear export protein, partial [Gonapodya sp. JEL0774]
MSEFLPSLGILMYKFKVAFMPYLDAVMWLIVERTLEYLGEPDGTDGNDDRKELRKAYCGFLGAVLGGELEEVFTSPRNHSRLNLILDSVLLLAGDSTEPVSQRAALTVLSRAVLVWAGSASNPLASGFHGMLSTSPLSSSPPSHGLAGKMAAKAKKAKQPMVGSLIIPRPNPIPGFGSFVYEKLVPIAFDALLAAGEGQSQLTIAEVAQLYKAILIKQGDEFLEFLRSRFLPSRNCPPPISEGFLDALRNPDLKALRKYME